MIPSDVCIHTYLLCWGNLGGPDSTVCNSRVVLLEGDVETVAVLPRSLPLNTLLFVIFFLACRAELYKWPEVKDPQICWDLLSCNIPAGVSSPKLLFTNPQRTRLYRNWCVLFCLNWQTSRLIRSSASFWKVQMPGHPPCIQQQQHHLFPFELKMVFLSLFWKAHCQHGPLGLSSVLAQATPYPLSPWLRHLHLMHTNITIKETTKDIC